MKQFTHKSIGLVLLILFSPFTDAFCQEQKPGYILDIRDNKIYLDLKSPEVAVGDKLQVIKEGGYFTHPVTGEKIKEDDETVALLEIIEARTNYSIATAYPEDAISKLQKGTKVLLIAKEEQPNNLQSGVFKKSIAVQPLTVLNIQGYLGIYIGDVLTEQLLKDDSFRVLDRQSLGIQADQMVLSSGGVLSEAELLQYSSRKGADYYITGTMYEPDVVELSTGVPVKKIFSVVGHAAEIATGKDLKVSQIAEYIPDKIEIKRLKAVVRISLRVVDVKTGEIKFLCTEMQQAEGESDINLEGGLLGGLKIRGGVTSFQNTITGKATEMALNNLTDYVINYFNGKISDKTYTGNVIEIKDLNKKLQTDYKGILITEHTKIPTQRLEDGVFVHDTTHYVTLNKGIDFDIKPKRILKVFSPTYQPSFMTGENQFTKNMKIGHIRIISSFKENSEGELIFNKSYNEFSFNKDNSFARVKNIWHTLILTSDLIAIGETESYDGAISYFVGIGYMLNWIIGGYASVGVGKLEGIDGGDGEKDKFTYLYFRGGLTKSLGYNYNLGGGISVFDDWVSLEIINFLRLKNNINLIYGLSVTLASPSSIRVPFGLGYSF
jgi:curli biogenesis system outer membrane secretion channel CsgG